MNTNKQYKKLYLSSNVDVLSMIKYLDNLIYNQSNLNIPIVLEADDNSPVMHSIVGIYAGYEHCGKYLNILWEPFTKQMYAQFLPVYEQSPNTFYVQPLGVFDNKTNTVQKITGFQVRSYT